MSGELKIVTGSLGNVFCNKIIPLPPGRLRYAHLTQANEINASRPVFDVTLLYPKKKTNINEWSDVQDVIGAMEKHKYGKKAAPDWKYPMLRDGDLPKDDGADRDGMFNDHWYIISKAVVSEPPEIIDGQKKPLSAAEIKCGMIIRLAVEVSLFPQNGGGVAYRLRTVQLYRDDGVRYRPTGKDALDEVPVDDIEGDDEIPDLTSPLKEDRRAALNRL